MARLNFAPVSSAQSGLLRFASAYFVLNGVLYVVLIGFVLLLGLWGRETITPTVTSALTIAIGAVTAVGLIWTGSQLSRGTRIGGFMALGFVVLPVAFAAATSQAMDWLDIVSAVLGVIVFALIWNELT
jgi:hypothetical protein